MWKIEIKMNDDDDDDDDENEMKKMMKTTMKNETAHGKQSQ